MSFKLTLEQFKNKTKTVTRRVGWQMISKGDIICGVKKVIGFKKGEKMERLGLIKIISSRREPLNEITKADCILEGFPEMEPKDFIKMLCESGKIQPHESVTRIEYEYL